MGTDETNGFVGPGRRDGSRWEEGRDHGTEGKQRERMGTDGVNGLAGPGSGPGGVPGAQAERDQGADPGLSILEIGLHSRQELFFLPAAYFDLGAIAHDDRATFAALVFLYMQDIYQE